VNVVAVPFTGLTGVTVIVGVILSDQLSSMPVAFVDELVSWRVQTPGTHWRTEFCISTVRPSSVASLPWGWNDPVNGAVPVVIEFSAVSSKTVLMKFEPLAPTPENKMTWVPFGAIRTPVSFESVGNAALSSRVI
jgi:hypothetical protein